MTQKVFGIGYSKTGTTSLESAFSILGYHVMRGHWANNGSNYMDHAYLSGDMAELLRITEYYDAFFDAPWGGCEVYPALWERYPEAKYLLSFRDKDKWYASFEKMIFLIDDNPATVFQSAHRCGMYGLATVFPRLFGITTWEGAREKVIDAYCRYNDRAAEFLRAKGADHLIIDITAEPDPWEKLCAFTGRPRPSWPFPHDNKGPSGTEARVNLAMELFQREIPHGSETILASILRTDPGNTMVQSLLAYAKLRCKRPDEATAILATLPGHLLAPDLVKALVGEYRSMARDADAAALLKSAIAAFPQDPGLRDLLLQLGGTT